MPKVSVIVPVYNVEAYLNRCIDSILNQTFWDFELILVDDGSTDKSGAICDAYKKMDERVRVIHKRNAGVSAARNTGIDAANGQYIMFVDSDDYIDAEMLTALILRMDNGVDLVACSIKMIMKTKEQNFTLPNNVYNSKKLLEMYGLEKVPQICLCGPWCKLYRNQLIKNENIKFDGALFLGEDTHFNLQYLLHCRNIVTMNDIYYFYMRENEESLFTKFRDYYYKNTRRVYEFTNVVMQRLACSEKALYAQKKRYVFGLIGNLYKAVSTADKSICLGYIREVSADPELKRHSKMLCEKKLYYIIAKLIQLKCYHLVYLGVRLWCKGR